MRALPAVLVLVALAGSTAPAQESASFRLDEHALNAGGRPAGGTVAASAGFRVTLEAIAGPPGHPLVAGGSFRAEGGFVPPYRPPGEVQRLVWTSDDTLDWRGERSAGTFNLYRDALAAAGPDPFGSCLASEIAASTAEDADVPAPGAGFLYLVTVANRLGEEGTLGFAWSGDERVAASACP